MGEGFGGWNCQHDWYPYFEGISTRNYTQAELDALNEKSIEYNGKMYNHYYIKGVVRGREVKIDLAPPNKDTDMGGYIVLDIVFGDADRAELVIEPFEITDDKTKQVIRGNRYFVRTVDEDGKVYVCMVKPSRTSDRSLLNMLLAE